MPEDKVDISPGVEMLLAGRNRPMQWKAILGELVDNSIDAGATRVDITFGPGRQLCVSDDGGGCQDPVVMVSQGKRASHAGTKLGRYGLGLKDAAIRLWGLVEIITTHKGTTRTVNVDWNHILNSGEWAIEKPIVVETGDQSGTHIRFSDIVMRPPSSLDSIIADLSFTYGPAILSGVQIALRSSKKKRRVCVATEPPPFDEIAEGELAIDGRHVRYQVGAVKDGVANPHYGLWYIHHYRVIERSSLGCGDYSTSRICGRVWLGDGWPLNLYKDGLSCDTTALEDALLAELRSLLERAQTKSVTLKSMAFIGAVNDALSAAFGGPNTGREKRDRGEQKGAVEPRGTDKTRSVAAQVHQVGDVIERNSVPRRKAKSRRRRGPTVQWGDVASGIGSVDLSAGRITLNRHDPFMRAAYDRGDVVTVTAVAVMLYIEADISAPDGVHRVLSFARDSHAYPDRCADVLGALDIGSLEMPAIAGQISSS